MQVTSLTYTTKVDLPHSAFRKKVTELKTYSLRGRAEIAESDFLKYNNEPVVDLSDGTFKFVPKWITNSYPKIQYLIISGNLSKRGVYFEKGFNKKVCIIADRMDLQHPFDGFDAERVICEIDFNSAAYREQFAQGDELQFDLDLDLDNAK